MDWTSTILVLIGIYVGGGSFWWSIAVTAILYLILGGHEKLSILARTVQRDFNALRMLLKTKLMYAYYTKMNLNIPLLWEKTVSQNPRKIALIEAHTGKKFTFDEVNQMANSVYFTLKDEGVKKTDVIGLLMPNCMEYVAFWLGAAKIGAITAFINTGNRGEMLRQALAVAKVKFIICDVHFLPALEEVINGLSEELKLFIYSKTDELNITKSDCRQKIDFAKKIKVSNKLNPEIEPLFLADQCLMIFTSGTTGDTTKAVRINGYKLHFMGWGINNLCHWKKNYVYYTPLPLHHGNGGCMIIGQMLWRGSTVVIRDKFSAKNFWKDVKTYKATVINYIGEICRYLLAQGYEGEEKTHGARIMVGNGLSSDVWHEFMARFNIRIVNEFYASSEGNCNLVNPANKAHSCGFLPSGPARAFFPVNIIKVDEETLEPIRNSSGLVKMVKPGEIGMIVGKVRDDVLSKFEGYTHETESKRKLISNVFSDGDRAFLSGDLMRVDKEGWCYFERRTGDTYRWKGENCSTTQIEQTLLSALSYRVVLCVVGINLERYSGECGLVCVQSASQDILQKLESALQIIPKYSRPVFIRFMDQLPITETFKIRKFILKNTNLKSEIGSMFVSHDGKYKKLDSKTLELIEEGSFRL